MNSENQNVLAHNLHGALHDFNHALFHHLGSGDGSDDFVKKAKDQLDEVLDQVKLQKDENFVGTIQEKIINGFIAIYNSSQILKKIEGTEKTLGYAIDVMTDLKFLVSKSKSLDILSHCLNSFQNDASAPSNKGAGLKLNTPTSP